MRDQNDINQSYFTSQGGINLPNMSFPLGIYSTTASGDNDLYTVPAGRRALLYACGTTCVVFTSSSIVTAELKNGGSYYTLTPPRTFAAVSSTGPQNVLNNCLILEAGESFSVNVSVAATYTHFLGLVEFDNTAPVKSVKLLNMASGNNLLYTCPAGKTAGMVDVNCGFGSGGVIISQQNTTSFTYFVSVVPNGQVIGPAFKSMATFTITGSLTPLGSGTPLFPPYFCLSPGDMVYVNASSAGANAIINVWEK